MRKKLLAGALALALLTGGVAAAYSASQSGALVSLSYLSGTFWNDLKATVKQEVDKDTTAMYNAAAAQAGQGGGASSSFDVWTGTNGDVVAGSLGSGLIWTSGSGVMRSGTLVDATAGVEVPAGGALSGGHRYLAETDVVLTVTSSAAQWMAEGKWTVTPGTPVQQPADLPFTDVGQNAWYRDDVAFVYENRLFNGASPTVFAPESKMQRCMMTTVLYRLAGEPAVSYAPLFRDIPDGQWYTAGTIWAGSIGVVSGAGPNVFNPYANVTRQEIAAILYRYASKMGYDVSASADLSGFKDAGTVASWGQQGISWAVGAGIMNGSGNMLLPTGDASRAEVAAMLHRFADWSAKS